MGQAQVSTYVPAPMKQAWKALAGQQGTTSAALLRAVMTKVLEANGTPPANATPDSQGHGTRLTLRLSAQEAAVLGERASQQGMTRQRCLIALIRANFLDMPTPTESELAALRDANRLLAAAGRNVNQIARAVNTGNAPTAIPASKSLLELLEQEATLRSRVTRLVDTTLYRWTARNLEANDDQP